MLLGYAALYLGAALLAATFVSLVVQPLLLRARYTAQGVACMSPFLPLIGDLPELRRVRETLPFSQWFSRLDAYGVSLFALGPAQRLRVRALDTVKAVLVSHASHFEKPQHMRTVLGPLMESGLLLAEGGVHRAQRSLVSPAFHFAALRDMAPLIARSAARLARKMVAAGEGGAVVPFHEEASAVTLHIIAAAAFGADFQGLLPDALPGEEGGGEGSGARIPPLRGSSDTSFMLSSTRALQHAVTQLLLNPLLLLPVPSVMRIALISSGGIAAHIARVRELGGRLIADRRAWRAAAAATAAGGGVAAPAAPLLLDRLLEAQEARTSGGAPLTDAEVLDESLTFVMAGHDTTAQVLTFAFLLLARAPEWRESLRGELSRVLGSPPRLPSADDVSSLPLLGAVVNEALRLYPPAPNVSRVCVRDCELPCASLPAGVLRIARGTVCYVPFGSIHRDAELWPNPDAFDPSRWLPHAGDAPGAPPPRLAHPLAFLPFSVGPRNCVGSTFALLEARIILAVLVSRLDWAIHASYVPREALAITLSPARGMPITVTARG